ncbi:MAG: hypothetical protein OXC06_02745 [Acidimicrobiaceae bacterium]|nr:hypothetical protein [Acidimicrobiaceae bacterium]
MSDLPPPPLDPEPSKQTQHDLATKASSRTPRRKSPIADEAAVVGFGCSISFVLVFPMGFFVPQLRLFEVSYVILLIGLGLSIMGVSRRDTNPGPRSLAVAGIVIAVCILVASPILLIGAAQV